MSWKKFKSFICIKHRLFSCDLHENPQIKVETYFLLHIYFILSSSSGSCSLAVENILSLSTLSISMNATLAPGSITAQWDYHKSPNWSISIWITEIYSLHEARIIFSSIQITSCHFVVWTSSWLHAELRIKSVFLIKAY